MRGRERIDRRSRNGKAGRVHRPAGLNPATAGHTRGAESFRAQFYTGAALPTRQIRATLVGLLLDCPVLARVGYLGRCVPCSPNTDHGGAHGGRGIPTARRRAGHYVGQEWVGEGPLAAIPAGPATSRPYQRQSSDAPVDRAALLLKVDVCTALRSNTPEALGTVGRTQLQGRAGGV
jgi:hypothetical protein